MSDRRPKSKGWLATHCQLCGHLTYDHDETGCACCYDDPGNPGPCAGYDDE